MKLKNKLLLAAIITVIFCTGYVFGTIQANRRTLCRAVEIIDTIKTPVSNLNAQDAIAIVAASATPRLRNSDKFGEQYKPNYWVNTTPQWESR